MDARKMRLEPKTRKASNRLHEINIASGNEWPRQWAEVASAQWVGFSSMKGPWLLVEPEGDEHLAQKFVRWVHAKDDPDFSVHEV